MSKFVVFGAGKNGEIFNHYIKEKTNHEIVCIVDNGFENFKNGGGKRSE